MKRFVDKLIAMLEERKKIVLSYKIVDAEDEAMILAYNESINIVNQLAEERNNDFCEWKEDEKFNWFFKSPHEGVGIVKEESGLFNFCPYCGKKIKVVE